MANFFAMSSSWSDEKLKEDDVGDQVCDELLQELNVLTSDLFCNKSTSAPTLQGADVSSLDLVSSLDGLGTPSRSDEKLKEDDFDDLEFLQELNILTSDLFRNKSTSAPTSDLASVLDEFITGSPQTLPHNIENRSLSSDLSLGSNILAHYSRSCHQMFYIRQDQQGCLWVYPDLGRPYNSLAGIDVGIAIYQVLHPQGITGAKKCPDSSHNRNACRDWNLIQAVVDQYNEDHGRSEGGALELEDILRMQVFLENNRWFYHFNFTTTQRIAGKKLVFAEVSFKEGTKLMEVNCFCFIDANDDGPRCCGCTNYGNPFVKHPKVTDAYTGGHVDAFIPFRLKPRTQEDESESESEVEFEVESVELDSQEESDMESNEEESKEEESKEEEDEEEEEEE